MRKERYHAIYSLFLDLRTQFELLDIAYHRDNKSEIDKLNQKINFKKFEINDEFLFHDVDLDTEIVVKALMKFKEHTLEERRKEIEYLCEYFGKKVNKKHCILMHEISENNMAFVAKHGGPPQVP